MCGILGLVLAAAPGDSSSSPNNAIAPINLASMAIDCLTAMQHRGTESSGLVGTDGRANSHFEIVKGGGLVRDAYQHEEDLARLRDCVALLGHNRYSTAGMKVGINCVQPFVLHTTVGLIAIAHNGELVNAHKRRAQVLREGVGLSTDTDSELIGQIIAKTIAQNMKCREASTIPTGDISRELSATMSAMDLSYALLVMTHDRIYALRDPFGNRPLCIGKILSRFPLHGNNSNASPASTISGYSSGTDCGEASGGATIGYIACSESCALPPGSQYLCEVEPGEMVEISPNGVKSVWQMMPKRPLALCVFEYVYFSRADSQLHGQQVHAVREECGRILAEEALVDVDIVSTVPESATAAAFGYAHRSGIQYEPVLQRNTYVGRSFIQPNTALRQLSVLKKFGVLRHNVEGKRIVLVDDSIVRGNTMGIIVRLLREYGAKEVHLRIASPPLRYPCYMGINIPSNEELLACREKTIADISARLNADSVQYLSVEGLKRAVTKGIKRPAAANFGLCTACLTGEYPIPLEI